MKGYLVPVFWVALTLQPILCEPSWQYSSESRCYDCHYAPDGMSRGPDGSWRVYGYTGLQHCALQHANDPQFVEQWPCHSGRCFIRRDPNGLVYRGCADRWNLPWSVKPNTEYNCQPQGYKGSLWWFCDGDLCNDGDMDSGERCEGVVEATRELEEEGLQTGGSSPFEPNPEPKPESDPGYTHVPPELPPEPLPDPDSSQNPGLRRDNWNYPVPDLYPDLRDQGSFDQARSPMRDYSPEPLPETLPEPWPLQPPEPYPYPDPEPEHRAESIDDSYWKDDQTDPEQHSYGSQEEVYFNPPPTSYSGSDSQSYLPPIPEFHQRRLPRRSQGETVHGIEYYYPPQYEATQKYPKTHETGDHKHHQLSDKSGTNNPARDNSYMKTYYMSADGKSRQEASERDPSQHTKNEHPNVNQRDEKLEGISDHSYRKSTEDLHKSYNGEITYVSQFGRSGDPPKRISSKVHQSTPDSYGPKSRPTQNNKSHWGGGASSRISEHTEPRTKPNRGRSNSFNMATSFYNDEKASAISPIPPSYRSITDEYTDAAKEDNLGERSVIQSNPSNRPHGKVDRRQEQRIDIPPKSRESKPSRPGKLASNLHKIVSPPNYRGGNQHASSPRLVNNYGDGDLEGRSQPQCNKSFMKYIVDRALSGPRRKGHNSSNKNSYKATNSKTNPTGSADSSETYDEGSHGDGDKRASAQRGQSIYGKVASKQRSTASRTQPGQTGGDGTNVYRSQDSIVSDRRHAVQNHDTEGQTLEATGSGRSEGHIYRNQPEYALPDDEKPTTYTDRGRVTYNPEYGHNTDDVTRTPDSEQHDPNYRPLSRTHRVYTDSRGLDSSTDEDKVDDGYITYFVTPELDGEGKYTAHHLTSRSEVDRENKKENTSTDTNSHSTRAEFTARLGSAISDENTEAPDPQVANKKDEIRERSRPSTSRKHSSHYASAHSDDDTSNRRTDDLDWKSTIELDETRDNLQQAAYERPSGYYADGHNPCDSICDSNPSGLFPDPSRSDRFIQCGVGFENGKACTCCKPYYHHCPARTTFDRLTKVCSQLGDSSREMKRYKPIDVDYDAYE